jgi:hypothetical protein
MATTKVTTGLITSLDATKLTGSIADARVPASAVTQHVTATDLTSVHQGIATLGLHMGVADNKAAFNLPNAFIDTFESDTGIATETTTDRNASEYVSSVVSALGGLTAVGVANFTAGGGSIGGWSWSGNDLSGIGGGATEQGGTTDGASTPLIFAASQPFEYHFVPVKSGSGYGGMVGIVNQSYAGNNFQEGASGGLDGIAGYMCVTAGNNNSRHGFAYVESSSRSQINTTAYSGVSCIFKRNASNYLEFWAAGSLVFTSTATHTFAIEVIISGQGGNNSNVNDQNYKLGTTTTNATGTLVSTVQTAPVATTTLSGVILYTDDTGTNTLGSSDELAIYLTANLQGTTPNWTGTNWTEAASYGTPQTFSGTTKQVKLGKTTVTSGTQVAMKAVWANQVATTAGGTLPLDSSSNSHTLTAVADATTSTTIYKSGVGTQSMQFDGTGDWYTVPDGSWADLGTGDFTMEAWVYYTGGSGWKGIIGSGNWGGPNYDWTWDMNSANAYPRLSIYNGSTEVYVQMTTAIATSTWTHLAVCRSGGTITQYLNGTANGTTVSSTHNVVSNGVVYIGNQSRGVPWQGNLQEVRMSNNARYTGTFTPSASAFVSDANTLLLVHGTGTAGVTGKVAHLNGWAVNY